MRRVLPVLLALGLLAAAVLAIPPLPVPPALATLTAGETHRSDDWVKATYANGWTYQGYSRKRPAYYQHGNRPDCALATGRTPTGSGNNVPAGVYIKKATTKDRAPSFYSVYADKGNGTQLTSDFTYWVHAQRDDSSNTSSICLNASVTTNSTGYFTVTFPRTMSATPTAVTWSDTAAGGATRALGNLVVDSSVSSTGFQGRALNAAGSIANTTLNIDFWAVVGGSVSTTDAQGQPYFHRAGVASVTTNGSGDATLDFSDFTGGEVPASIQVTGGTTNPGPGYYAAGVIADTVDANDATLHIRDWNGNNLANRTVTVHYIAVGNQGGAVHPWGASGYRQLGGIYHCDGDTIRCVKWLDEEADSNPPYPLSYELESSFLALGSIEGADWEDMMDAAVASVNNADVDLPDYSRDTTPDASEDLSVIGTSLPDGYCGVGDIYLAADTESGVNRIVDSQLSIDDDDSELWGRNANHPPPNQTEIGCPVEHALLHEFVHTLGFGHSDSGDTDSLMHPGPPSALTTFHTTLASSDRDHMRALYGYSSSLLANGFKYSSLVNPGVGFSTGLVTVTVIGGTVGDDGNLPVVPLSTTRLSWNGGLPAVIWQKAGDLNGVYGGPPLEVGRTYVVVVRDSDGRLMGALPVKGNSVEIPEDYWHVRDDVDGGSKRTVALDRLKAKA
jgi:hypothetical protein